MNAVFVFIQPSVVILRFRFPLAALSPAEHWEENVSMNTVYFGGVEFALYNSGNPIELGPTVEPKLFGLLDKGEPGEYEIRFEAKSRDSRVRVEITTCDKAHTAYELNLYTPSGAHVIPRGCQKAQIQISHALLIKGENVETARGSFTIDASVECF
ncbi:MAG: hypothetical protein AAB881_01060, partial [Patescibacteria group bacterium]